MDDDQVDIVPRHGLVRISQARTIPAAEFDLTHADSDVEDARRPVGSSDSVRVDVVRPRPEDGHDVPRFGPWVGGTPTPILEEPPPAVPPGIAVDHDVDDTESVDTSVQGDSEDTETLPEVEVDVLLPRAPQLRAAFEAMDQVNVVGIFRYRAAVMKTVPRFLQGPVRNVMKVVLEEVMASEDPTRNERGWKAFLMLPRMLLHRPPGGGHITRKRFEAFNRGDGSD